MPSLKGWKRTAPQGEQTSSDGTYKVVRNAYGEWHLYAICLPACQRSYMATTEYVNTYSTLASAKWAAHIQD
jgi:hypothetical protein